MHHAHWSSVSLAAVTWSVDSTSGRPVPSIAHARGGQVLVSRCACSDKLRSDRRLVRYVGLNWLSECPSLTLHLMGVDSGDLSLPNIQYIVIQGWFGSRVVSVLDSGAEGPGFKSQPQRCRVTVLGKLFTPIVPLFTKQRNW